MHADQSKSQSPSIVVVDDNEYLSELLEVRFRSERWKTSRFISGDGLQHFLSRHSADVILLDVQLADGNGFDVLEKLKADPARAAIPVLMLTCSTSSHDVRRAKALGASGYIAKPFNVEHLVRRVALELAEKEAHLL